MENKLKELKSILAEISDMNAAIALLGWDQQVNMPSGGAELRGYQLGTLSKLSHQRSTSPELGKLIDELAVYAEQLDPDSDGARLIKVAQRDFVKQVKVPAEMVEEMAQVSTVAFNAWQEARAEDHFEKFQPYLEKIIDLRRRYAALFAPFDHVYDPLLDDFEPGLKTADVREIFTALRPQQVALLQAIAERPQVENAFLKQYYEEDKQWEFGVEAISRFGYDWNRGRQDKSAHPFTSHFGRDDVRITTRLLKDDGASALFSTMHEAGHAMYEQGVKPELARTPLSNGASLAVHESQSRMWENLVGRSLPFWEFFYPRFQAAFPKQLDGIDLETFYKGINRVEPSLIRVEADEATYNLHIMLRLELEIAMMEGSLEAQDLPEAWNARMEEYLGIVPQNNAQGVLQDVHWSGGAIGYFSTYALGNLVSAQLWECIHRDLPDLDEQIRSGEFSALLQWLRKNIHQHGQKFEPQELVQRVTGSKIDPAPYMRYLQNKYGAIYGL